MFTGIVERTGTVKKIAPSDCGRVLTVDAGPMAEGLPEGGSIAINGCCTTALDIKSGIFTVDLMQITLDKTNLGNLTVGDPVNLERPMKLGEELSGHLVQGHVDGVGEVVKVEQDGDNRIFTVKMPPELTRYVISTGSIAVDGISLTVAYLNDDCFQVGIIPHTWQITNMRDLRVGSRVNLEVDMIGKYIEKLFPDSWKSPAVAAEN